MARAQAAIERICGQRFSLISEVRTFDGMGRPVLNVRRAIQEVNGITLLGSCGGSDTALDVSDIRISGSKTMLAWGNVVPMPFRGLRWPSRCGSFDLSSCVFPMGFQNIQVDGIWGAWAAVPEEIILALGLLIQHASACDNPIGPHTAAHSAEATVGDWSYTIKKVWQNVIQDATTGFGEVDSILARYVAPPVVIGV
jgi:hypothetical protein